MTIYSYSVNTSAANPKSLKKMNEYCDVREAYLHDPDDKHTEQ